MPKFKKKSEYAALRGEPPVTDEMALKTKIVNDALHRMACPPLKPFEPGSLHYYGDHPILETVMPNTKWTIDMIFAGAVAIVGGACLGTFGIGIYELARYGVPYLDRLVEAYFQ